MTKHLIQVHSQEPQLLHCSCCDTESKEVNVFYKELENDTNFGFQTYLECCVSKVGQVIDWYEYEEYKKKVSEYKFQGIKINKIKGYIK